MEDAVELLRPLSLRCVTRAVDHGELRTLDQRVRAFGMRQRKQRIVGAPDQLDRDLEVVQSRRHVVVTGQERTGVGAGPERRAAGGVTAIWCVNSPAVAQEG